MRLINTKSHELREFVGTDVPPYAVLSHTWEDDEVTYQEYAALTPDQLSTKTGPLGTVGKKQKRKRGYEKIERTCSLARKSDIEWAWVDTCCIDKTSSAELTEAINSMFRWYKESAACYAYLSDLDPVQRDSRQENTDENNTQSATSSTLLRKDSIENNPKYIRFSSCRWFTRGWTLQELVASPRLGFYNKKWGFEGEKSSLTEELAKITNISSKVLINSSTLPAISVAQRLSWAAHRETTRAEDAAYCLLGLFDVHMPLLYGEGGQKAFIRLQEEIAKECNDLSLFAWSIPEEEYNHSNRGFQKHWGILANSPRDFADCTDMELWGDPMFNPECIMTSKGLRVTPTSDSDSTTPHHHMFRPLTTLPPTHHPDEKDNTANSAGNLLQTSAANTNITLRTGALWAGPPDSPGTYFFSLLCHRRSSGFRILGIPLQQHGRDVYTRVHPHCLVDTPAPGSDNRPLKMWPFYIRKTVSPAASIMLAQSHRDAVDLNATIQTLRLLGFMPSYDEFDPPKNWDVQRGIFLVEGAFVFSCRAVFRRTKWESPAVMGGSTRGNTDASSGKSGRLTGRTNVNSNGGYTVFDPSARRLVIECTMQGSDERQMSARFCRESNSQDQFVRGPALSGFSDAGGPGGGVSGGGLRVGLGYRTAAAGGGVSERKMDRGQTLMRLDNSHKGKMVDSFTISARRESMGGQPVFHVAIEPSLPEPWRRPGRAAFQVHPY